MLHNNRQVVASRCAYEGQSAPSSIYLSIYLPACLYFSIALGNWQLPTAVAAAAEEGGEGGAAAASSSSSGYPLITPDDRMICWRFCRFSFFFFLARWSIEMKPSDTARAANNQIEQQHGSQLISIYVVARRRINKSNWHKTITAITAQNMPQSICKCLRCSCCILYASKWSSPVHSRLSFDSMEYSLNWEYRTTTTIVLILRRSYCYCVVIAKVCRVSLGSMDLFYIYSYIDYS